MEHGEREAVLGEDARQWLVHDDCVLYDSVHLADDDVLGGEERPAGGDQIKTVRL